MHCDERWGVRYHALMDGSIKKETRAHEPQLSVSQALSAIVPRPWITEIHDGVAFPWITSTVLRGLTFLKGRFPWIKSRFHGIGGRGEILVNEKEKKFIKPNLLLVWRGPNYRCRVLYD